MDRKRLTAALAALTLAVPLAGTAIAGDSGKGDERPETAPGQQKQDPAPSAQGQEQAAHEGKAATPGKSKAARPAEKAKSKPAKKAKSKPARPKAENTHAKAGKTTICHSTGSSTNPFVTITISNNALKAHSAHHDGKDIIPAPAAGCPKGEAGAAPAPAAKGGKKKVTICHATGSATNPYVKITIAEPAVEAHKGHQNGEDIIPAPEGDCPAAAAAAAARAAAPAPALVAAPAASLVGQAFAGGEASLPAPRSGVLGETVSGGAAPSGVAPAAAVRSELGSDAPSPSLPFTGLELWLVLVAGLGALLAGVALFRATGRHPA